MNEKAAEWLRTAVCIALPILCLFAVLKGIGIESSVDSREVEQSLRIDQLWEQYSSQDGSVQEYRYRISGEDSVDSWQKEGELWLSMKTYLDEFEIYLGDRMIYQYSDIYGINGGNQHMIRLPSDTGGKQLVIRARHLERQKKAPDIKAYLGTENSIWTRLLNSNFYALIFGVFMAFLGLATLIGSVFFSKRTARGTGMGLRWISGFIFAAGLWVVTDSELLLFVTDKMSLISLLSFFSFMVMPAFLLRFISYMFGRKPLLVWLPRLFFFMAAMYLLNYLHPVIPGFLLLLPVHLGCFAAMVGMLFMGIRMLKKQKNAEVVRMMQGFAFLSIFSLGAFILFYIDSTSQYAVLYCIGICLFCLCLIISAFTRIWGQIEENANNLAYKRLAYTDTMTGLLNRTAYMEEEQKPLEGGCIYIILDINNLKIINDRYGHRNGDLLIITAAQYIKKYFSHMGECYRIGGDEFLVICKGCSAVQAAGVIEDMQLQIQKDNDRKDIPLRIAAGYAEQLKQDTAETLFQKADHCMYENKEIMKREGI